MILLDTHVVLWLAQVPEMLSAPATAAIRIARQEDGVAIADKTLWELAMMISRGAVHVRTTPLDFLRAVEESFAVLPITGAIAEKSIQFSKRFPKDPADRIIAATAVIHGIRLVTSDAKIRKSGEVRCVW
jgi:PIN domain nuclease of toxin-antitoxin system